MAADVRVPASPMIQATESTRKAAFAMAFRIWVSSFAPKYWETTMPPPLESPAQNEKKRKWTGEDAPTAASAPAPTYRPTIAESARL